MLTSRQTQKRRVEKRLQQTRKRKRTNSPHYPLRTTTQLGIPHFPEQVVSHQINEDSGVREVININDINSVYDNLNLSSN